MLAKYTIFTILTSVISFWCMFQVQEPYQHINEFYNTFCVYLSKRVRDFLSSKNILTCIGAQEHSDEPFTNENEILFTKELLSQYTGDSEKLYLSILGEVFDVSQGKKHYGKGEGYHGFTGNTLIARVLFC